MHHLRVQSKKLFILIQNDSIKNRLLSCNCKKVPKCDPKPPCDAYKPCPPPPSTTPPLKCIPDCSPSGEADGGERMYRNVTIFLAIPILILTGIGVYMKVEEDDLRPRPKFIPYSYLYIRNKRFPWGDGNHSLFHNPKKNAVPPNGYETEDPNALRQTDDEEEEEG